MPFQIQTATHRPAHSTGFAVIDVETTGFGKADRIIEIAVVTLDPQMRCIDEYETLVDPQRDLGPTNIHGITPSMVSLAPSFSDIAAALAMKIANRTLVAHNRIFEERMLLSELARLNANLDSGRGICTLRLTNEKLPQACRTLGVRPPQHHRALSDARATAELLQRLNPDEATSPMTVYGEFPELNLRTHRRLRGCKWYGHGSIDL